MSNSDTERLRMQDPRTQYPQPPFARQPQGAPGLASKMEPKPDHGETTYLGYGRLTGRRALVTGADSGIGRAAAIAFARAGAHLPHRLRRVLQADLPPVRERLVVDLLEE